MNLKNTKPIGNILLLLLMSGCFSACAGREGRLIWPQVQSVLSHEEKNRMLEFLHRREKQLVTVRTLGRLQQGFRLVKGKSDFVMAHRNPHWLRVDAISPLGAEIFQFLISEEKIKVYWPQENTYSSSLSLPIDAKTLLHFLVGGMPLENGDHYTLIQSAAEKMVLMGEDGNIFLDCKESLCLPGQYAHFNKKRKLAYLVSFEDYQNYQGFWFPSHIKFQWIESRSQLDVKYYEVEMNPSLEKKVFQLEIPKDATIITD